MNNLPETHIQQNIEEDNISVRKIFDTLLDKWHWFVISVIMCALIAFLYTRYTAPTYQISARLLVNDDEKGGGLGKQAGSLMDLGGLLGSSNSVDNEVEILKTRFLMEQVVRDMQLNKVYAERSNLVSRELYKPPFKINILKEVDTIKPTKIEIQSLKNGKFRVTSDDFEKEVKWNETFHIQDIGALQIVSEPGKVVGKGDYIVNITSIDDRVAELMKQLSVGISNKQVTIIDLGLSYALPNKGEDILNTLLDKYTGANLNDKNAIADSTYKFIKLRLNVIATELGDVENEVETFKKKNRLADMSEQGKLLVQTSGEYSSELAKAQTQVTVLTDLEEYLKDEGKNKRVFPTSLLPQDMVFSGLMEQYNSLLIERDKQLLGVTEESPLIKNMDVQIRELRAGILANIQSTKNTFVVTRNRLQSQLNKSEGQIGGVPEIEKNYLKLARNQQIKQELYIFLMQKAEETAISKTSNIAIAKTIDPPKSQILPISPKKSVVYILSLIVGLFLPIVIIFIRGLLNTGITTKEDITNRTIVPVIGEISHNQSNDNMIVANQGRSAISEQFRALRTNLSFYLKNNDEKIILLTSSMSGEGKSFTAINLGNILSLTGKKVLLMEMDLRKPGLSAKLNIPNTLGFSNYTINEALTSKDIIKSLALNPNMSIISSGPLPPNPAETLMSRRTIELIEEVKEKYDYIILDAPPIGIITDAQLLSQFADMTIYLVRQKVTKKNQLSIVDDLYRSGKMNKIGIVVNDIVNKTYGYGYGYGNYGEVQEPRIIDKIKGIFKKV
jgi:tyrosine-protein kinase Etk/Wzc